MAVFPTLSMNPSVEGWKQTRAKDPTVRTDMEGGYEQTYPAFTRKVREWTVNYIALPVADKNLIEAHEDAVKVGCDAFTWTNPTDNVNYTVRFAGPVQYKLNRNSSLYWDVEFVLREV